MRTTLVVLSALAAITFAKNRDCKMCVFITAVIKKAMMREMELTNEKVIQFTCPRLLRNNPRFIEKPCKRIVREILGSRILMRKIKRKKGLGDWTSYFCSRELSKKYCPNGYYNPTMFRDLSGA
ncbi:hypothetical protein ANCCAN_09200 [Ancylostoma caninum]|uniref:Saposin B-type domain-containing protein n=1 Tax=Ancylostoma caninum TaxID=29170 RepID=A0A368GK49_ANCCA|nr:hypothetical protein ANCCAN_09200 [Ancylostoma caninum]